MPSKEKIGIGQDFILAVHNGRNVTVVTNVINVGGKEGDYLVELKLNKQTRHSQQVILGPGQSQDVVFVITGNKLGHYIVQIAEREGEFTTSLWINWWLIAGLTISLVLFVFIAWHVLHRRRQVVKGTVRT